ncbi:modifier of mdg4 [Leptopilina boulardi]|uniref:modifier of mdg4 n=1 Tax=Leptopilina boulardi TaxID=63433 RepID=UPI0021F5CCF7|nr:modifier of mdg4 [Leptopilina boulardi]XP_051175519.1 modifier of mdg4 [Leptopilina boulardi]
MEGQQFCLRWHNFQNTLLSSLPKLLDGGHLTDVTLSAGGRHIHAHRIILSACSFYFKELFKDLNASQHPVIVLPGMEYSNLCALVTFMYNGEVNIYQEQLPALLAMADTLHIRGLADIAGINSNYDNGMIVDSSNPSSQDKDVTNNAAIKTEIKDNTLNSELESVPYNYAVDSIDEELSNDLDSMPYSVKTQPYYSINAKLNQRERKPVIGSVTPIKTKTTTIETNYPTNVNDESSSIVDESNNTIIEDNNSKLLPILDTNLKFISGSLSNRQSQTCNKTSVTCLVCGKQLSNQYNLRVHMETHSNSSYSCAACSHVSRSRDALRKHVSYRHPVTSPQKRSRYSSKS